MANRPPVRLLLLGIRGRLLVWKDGRRTAEFFDSPASAAVSQHCGRRAIKREILVVPFRLTIAMSSGWFQPTTRLVALLALHQSLDFGKMECAPEIWLSAPSILDTCPLSLSAPGLKRSSQAQSIRWLVGNLVHHGHSETGEKTDACWVTTTTLLLGTVGLRRPPPQLRSAEDYHNGTSNGTSLATMRLQTQGNCPSWGVCFPPPTHPRVPCTRFKIGKPLSRLSASGTHCASPAVFWCWARFHPPCMPFCFQP